MSPLRTTPLRRRAAILVVAVASIAVTLVTAITVLERLDRQASARAESARLAQTRLNDLELALMNQETGLRGYALTGDASFLEAYDLGRSQASTANRELHTVTDPGNRARIVAVMSTARTWDIWAQSRREATAAGGTIGSDQLAEGKRLFGTFRAADASADQELAQQEANATAEATKRSRFLSFATPAAGAAMLLGLLLLAELIFRSILRPIDGLASAAQNLLLSRSASIPGLERKDELGHLAKALATLQQQAVRRLELSEAMTEVNSYVRMDEFIGPGLDRASQVLDAKDAAIVMIRDDGLHVAVRNVGNAVLPVPTSSDHDPALQALRTGEPTIGDYRNGDWDARARSFAARRGLGPVLAVPMVSRNTTVGALIMMRSLEGKPFTEVDVQVARLIAGPLGAAVQVARAFEEKEEQSRALQILNETALAATGVLDPAALSWVVVDKTRDLLGGHHATLCLFHPGDGLLHIVADSHPQPWSHAFEPGQGALGVAFQARSPVVVEDYARWHNAQDWALERGMKSVVAVPLLAGDRRVGSLAVHSDAKHLFTPDDVRLLTLMAAQVAPALEAARLYTRMASSGS